MVKLQVNSSSTIYGDRLNIYIDNKPVAFAKSCSIEIQADTIDTSNKMSLNWKEFLTSKLSYTINCESLVTYKASVKSEDPLSKVYTYADLLDAMVKRELVSFKIAKTAEDDDTYAAETEYFTGTAIITNLSLSAPAEDLCTSSISLQGSGELAVKDGFAKA